jgi:CRISPR system Cascade subunit CasD
MSTLLLRFAAPLQAWGVDSKFNRRTTEREPTKSGVVGFLAAALGRRREESIADLVDLKFGVRVDQPGQFLQDYHTAHSETDAFVTRRYYLADAVFLVGLEGEDALLQTIESAVRSPVFPLYFGRRSCPPAGQVSLGFRAKPLHEALSEEPWQASLWYRKRALSDMKMTLVCDSEHTSTLRRRDLPISFAQTHRKYTFRSVDDRPDAIPIENPDNIHTDVSTKHDPFVELGG